jgi:hypothetical protein
MMKAGRARSGLGPLTDLQQLKDAFGGSCARGCCRNDRFIPHRGFGGFGGKASEEIELFGTQFPQRAQHGRLLRQRFFKFRLQSTPSHRKPL